MERYINWLPHACPQQGTWPATQACALTGNSTGDPLVRRLALSPLSHTSQVSHCSFLKHQGQKQRKGPPGPQRGQATHPLEDLGKQFGALFWCSWKSAALPGLLGLQLRFLGMVPGRAEIRRAPTAFPHPEICSQNTHESRVCRQNSGICGRGVHTDGSQ